SFFGWLVVDGLAPASSVLARGLNHRPKGNGRCLDGVLTSGKHANLAEIVKDAGSLGFERWRACLVLIPGPPSTHREPRSPLREATRRIYEYLRLRFRDPRSIHDCNLFIRHSPDGPWLPVKSRPFFRF